MLGFVGCIFLSLFNFAMFNRLNPEMAECCGPTKTNNNPSMLLFQNSVYFDLFPKLFTLGREEEERQCATNISDGEKYFV